MKGRVVLSLCILSALLCASSPAFADQGELDDVTKAIKEKNSRWSAIHTAISKWSPEERKKRLGSQYPLFSFTERKFTGTSAPLPSKLDWRNYTGNSYVTPVKDQGDCGACWAFAVTSALESKVLIASNTSGAALDLSEKILTSCSGAGNCEAGYINAASDFISNYGLPPEDCCPYTASDTSCSNGCPEWPSNAYTVPGWSLVDPNLAAMKEALYNHGPLVTLMAVQSDFLYYGSGIYSHAWGSFEGYHAALIVGYDDMDQYFIVKSSWGTDWGENGYFRIAYSEIHSEAIFGCWLIAYESAIPATFPILEGIARISAGVKDTSDADHARNSTGAERGRRELQQTDKMATLPSAGMGEPLSITGSSQISVGGSQTLTASGGCEGSYTWTNVAGGGSLTGSSGTAVTYTAPNQNPGCESNVTIRCTDGCGQYADITIAVNNPAVAGDAYSEYTGGCFSGLPGGSKICGMMTNVYHPYNYGCNCQMIHQCDGAVRENGPIAMMWDYQPPIYDWCAKFSGICAPQPPVDIRSSAQKAAGCCPASFPGTGGPGSMGAGGCGGNNDSSSPNINLNSAANITSGNLNFSQDAAGISLSYNSIDSYIGPLGKKWTHNYNVSLTPLSDDNAIKLKMQDGNIIYYRLSGGIYYPEAISGDASQIVKNPDASYTRTFKSGSIHRFNPAGRLTSITDRYGKTTTLTYSGNNLAGITDPNGRTTGITTTNGLITSITDPGGRSYSLVYSGGLLSSLIDPLGNAWLFTYDAAGRMLTKTDALGNTITYAYDTQGRLQQAAAPDGTRTITYTRKGITTVTEKDGGLWTYHYDPTFAVKTQKTDPLGNITRYTYDLKRNHTSTIDPDGNITRYTYDASSNLTSVTDSLSHTTSYTYNAMNLVATITDPRGGVTAYSYDARGNLTSAAAPIGTTAFQYDARGNIAAVTDPDGRTITFSYDTQNNITSITDPLGNMTGFTYDAAGNRLTMMDPLGHVTSYAYNALNQMIQVTDPNGHVTQLAYDFQGNVLSTTDANGRPTQYGYNYRGQLTRITDALNNLTQLSYGPTGCGSGCGGAEKLAALTDALNRSTGYAYDLAGQLVEEKDPQARETHFTYDSRGNILSRAKPDGRTITYTYDAANRLSQIQYPGGGVTQYQYDANGNVIYAANGAIAYTLVYDGNNRLSRMTDSSGRTLQYVYNASGNRIALITPENRMIVYGYDNAGRLASITADSRTFGYGYDAASRRTSLTLPNGTAAANIYDGDGNLARVQHNAPSGKVLADVNHTYDAVNNRLTRTDTVMSGTESTGIDALTYGTANELLTLNSTTYNYDLSGNRIRKTETNGGTTYTYDDENRLVRLATTGGQVITYAYDPFGRRVEKNVNGTITRYLYDREDILLEYDSAGTVTARYIQGPGIDEPLAMEKSGQNYYYHADGLGSIIALTDSIGAVVQQYRYDSFGNMTNGTPAVTQPYTYTAREYDPETGLYFYRARHYDPQAGRFLQRDPIGFAGGDVNLYAYAGNNPVNRVDPNGKLAFYWHLGITFMGSLNSGYSFRDSWSLAKDVMAEDRDALSDNPNDTVVHAMGGQLPGGGPQTPVAAIAIANAYIDNVNYPRSGRIHSAQDLPGHAGENMEDFGWSWSTVKHIIKDITGGGTVGQTYQNTRAVLNSGCDK